MPKLSNHNHEKLAMKTAKALLDSRGEEIVKTDIYQSTYGCTRDSARSSAPVVFALPSVQKRIEEIISLKNSPEDISQDLADLRLANKQIFSPSGKLIEIRDNTTRLGAVNTVLKVHGISNQNINIDSRSVNINTPDQTALLSSVLEGLQSINAKLDDYKSRNAKELGDINR